MGKISQFHSIHNHSNFSDGADSIFDIVEQAQNIGLSTVGISDHLCVYNNHKGSHMEGKDIGAYVKEIEKARKHFKGMKILLGAEVDIPLNAEQLKTLARIKAAYKFDYYIGSQHCIPYDNEEGRWTIGSPEMLGITDPALVLQIQEIYWDSLLIFARERIFDIIGHMDFIGWISNPMENENIRQKVKYFLSMVKLYKKTIEINTDPLSYIDDCNPASDILDLVLKSNIPVLITSDSHNKNNLTYKFDFMNDRASEIINKKYTLYNPYRPKNKIVRQLTFCR